ncbi:hypothetical protein JCGZ_22821 [Jatropha curcas]|uniref:RING-type domain-containing protein n=1 Tax=Jatropha curcas TaxID=180498 RepID=A0A067LGJ2_JATCU|nr:hypothetical protein JCGZ_22821 [Jatropha curcas]
MFNSLVTVASYLKWAWDFLLHYSFFSNHHHLDMPELNLCCYEEKEEESKECAVCLCKIENGEETKELRCSHVFHGVCLDRWLGYRSSSCSLCRDLIRRRTFTDPDGREVLVFKYCSFSSGNDRETWWLR